MIRAQGEDFSIHFFQSEDLSMQLLLKCKKCTWEVDLNKLDTLLDFSDELSHHEDMCQEWSNHEHKHS